MASYPKRLIEVDLPIKRISAHARREKSIRHGHISTLHIWWARRPLAACRAVICASLWPDPADELCPQVFRDEAARQIKQFAEKAASSKKLAESCDPSTGTKWLQVARPEFKYDTANPGHLNMLRFHLLDFIADFSNWDNSTVKEYLETSRALTQAAHEALGGVSGTRPLVVDPFAGGGAIPLEALRIGADAFASDLNPVPVLLNKVVLEYIPKYGQKLADEVRKWGKWVKSEAENELAEFYHKDPDGSTPIAYLWARTIECEGPGCGAEIPLLRSLWLGKKTTRPAAIRLVADRERKRVDFAIIEPKSIRDVDEGTVRRGSATCPCCGYSTPVDSVRRQLRKRKGGAADARMFAVVTTPATEQGRVYRLPTENDVSAASRAVQELDRRKSEHRELLSLVPDEPLPPQGTLGFRIQLYGMECWGDLFTGRQALTLCVLCKKVVSVYEKLCIDYDSDFARAVQLVLALNVDKMADYGSSLASWSSPASQETVRSTFGRQALPIVWDFAEAYPFAASSGGWEHNLQYLCEPLETGAQAGLHPGTAERSDATAHPLPDDIASAVITDPPYYDAVPYADLSDFFLVWLKRSLSGCPGIPPGLSPKDEECVLDNTKGHDRNFFERTMTKALAEARRVASCNGVAVVVFAHKSTAGWETQLKALVEAGWTITGSWPIDTERQGRMRANASAALASSIHLICRPRENSDGSLQADSVGDWRDILHELPIRIHEWMPRLAREGVVGADAIFACLGPALEIFSRYSRVEKASGEQVALREYLEEVWAAVSREALTMIFEEADATGFEEDARITAMWLWTLSTEVNGNGSANEANGSIAEREDSSDDDEESGSQKQAGGFTLEFDAARKIAQGLGVHLERLDSLIEAKGETARLLPVSDRAARLFGKEELDPTKQTKKRSDQLRLDGMLDIEEESDASVGLMAMKSGETTLDRVHQSMLLFSAGRSDALQRFLVEDGIGRDQRFWKLAQALSALYPKDSDEKRWVDGVLARKKGLGF